ncbi:MAG: microbial collagenase [Phenylobacterium sp.]|jgi:microbial collagenase
MYMKTTKSLVAASVLAMMSAAQAAPSSPMSLLKQDPQIKKFTPDKAKHQQSKQKQSYQNSPKHGVEQNHNSYHNSSHRTTHQTLAPTAAIPRALTATAKSSKSSHKTTSQSAVTLGCDLDVLANATPVTVIDEIKNRGIRCVNELFSASHAIQEVAMTSAKMIAVSDTVKTLSVAYAGGGDGDIEAMFAYLRVGNYAATYGADITFSAAVKPAFKAAIDAFAANSHFYDNDNEHGKALSEVMIAMDNIGLQDVYLPIAKQWLTRFNATYAENHYMRSSVNSVFNLILRGQWNSNFVAQVATDTELVTVLKDFALSSWLIDHQAEYMASNAGLVLGRLKYYSGTAIQANVDAALNSIFSTYQMYGYGDAVWLTAAGGADNYGNCADYDICGFAGQVEALALSQTYICSPSIKIRSQNMTAVQHVAACSAMGAEESHFHAKLKTNNIPVADDVNSQLQVNIFDSDDDYGTYGWTIFNINTDNGGMYLEGTPATPGNIPNFIAYEASYANADHYVWNLEHEYVHYLDGRFDKYGGFNTSPHPITWWSEGVAEYISHQDDNQAAVDTIKDGSTYPLTTILGSTYSNADSDQIYRWGYLAVRFMFENHADEVTLMLAATRTGDWTAYKTRIDSWGNSYESEFAQWLQAYVASNDTVPVAITNGPYTAQANSVIDFSAAGSTDPNGTIVSYNWYFADGRSLDEANPQHSYSEEGVYNARLTVTDNDGISL